jgi:hypothetical protein
MALMKHAVFALSLIGSAAQADDMPLDVRTALTAEVARFDATFNAGNMGAIFDYMPAKVVEKLAKDAGISQDALFAAMQDEIDSAMRQVTIHNFSMDMDAASWQNTPDGTIGYALIPTVTDMTVVGIGKVHATGETLAFAEGAKWYLVRVDDASQAQLLTVAYPSFDGVTFTPGKMDMVAE